MSLPENLRTPIGLFKETMVVPIYYSPMFRARGEWLFGGALVLFEDEPHVFISDDLPYLQCVYGHPAPLITDMLASVARQLEQHVCEHGVQQLVTWASSFGDQIRLGEQELTWSRTAEEAARGSFPRYSFVHHARMTQETLRKNREIGERAPKKSSQ